jgi:hypothetical protein
MSSSGTELVTQGRCLDAIDRDLLAVHLDHGNPLPVPALELRVARDVDLINLDPELGGQGGELAARPLAQVAVAGDVERDGRAQG